MNNNITPVSQTIELCATDGFRYLKFEPPITEEQFADIPLPEMPSHNGDDSKHFWHPITIQKFKGGVSTIGFYSDSFYTSDEVFTKYAVQVARHLGSTSVIPEIKNL